MIEGSKYWLYTPKTYAKGDDRPRWQEVTLVRLGPKRSTVMTADGVMLQLQPNENMQEHRPYASTDKLRPALALGNWRTNFK